MSSLRTGAVRGALSVASGQGLRFLIQAASIIVLSRMLPPDDFGLVAMVAAFVGISNLLSDFGFSAAVLRDPNMPRKTRDALFSANLVLALLSAAILWVAAPLIADFYTESRVESVVRALCVAVILNGIAPQYRAELAGKLRFGLLAASDPASQAVGLCAAVAAVCVLEVGYWALVIQQVAAAITLLVVLISGSGYIPRLQLSWSSLRGHLALSLSMLGLQVTGYAASAAGPVVLGRAAGATVVGLYSRGFQLFSMPLAQLAAPMTRVAVPILSRVPPDRLELAACRVQRMMCFVLIPPLAAIAAGGPALFSVLLGDDWSSAGVIVQILAIGGVFQVLGYIHYWLFLTRDRLVWLALWEVPVWSVFTILAATVSPESPDVVAAFYASGLAAIWVLGGVVGMRVIGMSWLRILEPAAVPVILGIAVGVGGIGGSWFSRTLGLDPLLELAGAAIGAAAGLALALILRRVRHDLALVVAEIRNVRRSRS